MKKDAGAAASFSSLPLSRGLLSRLKRKNFAEPTTIQQRAIPLLLHHDRNDLIASAKTGSGKTLAYVLPAIERLSRRPGTKHPRCLVLAPSRDLAQQISDVFREFSHSHQLSVVTAIMDEKQLRRQEAALRAGCDVLVATLGRLLDLCSQSYVDLSHVNFFVLDEADRLLESDEGVEQVLEIVGRLSTERQTVMVSATVDDLDEELVAKLMRRPRVISLSPFELVPVQIRQSLLLADDVRHKKALLRYLIEEEKDRKRLLVFARTRRAVESLAAELDAWGVRACWIHGGKRQAERDEIKRRFRRDRKGIMVSTRELMGIGIDDDGISHIVNFDVPQTVQKYRQCVGRTGRAGATGCAFTLVEPQELEDWSLIEKDLGQPVKRIVFEKLAPQTRQHQLGPFKHRPPSIAEWPYVWTCLYSDQPQSAELRQLAQKWLEAAQESRFWPQLWKMLVKDHGGAGELFDLALHWLSYSTGFNRSWRVVFKQLIRHPHYADAAVETVLAWLAERNPTSREWVSVWTTLWLMSSPEWDEDDSGDDELDDESEEGTGEEGPPLEVVWPTTGLPADEAWRSMPGRVIREHRDRLREFAIAAIAYGRDSRGHCHQVWRRMLEEAGAGSALWEDTLNYVYQRDGRHRGNHVSWPLVWKFLVREHSPNDQLIRRGAEWLADHQDYGHEYWSVVWSTLRVACDSAASQSVVDEYLRAWVQRGRIESTTDIRIFREFLVFNSRDDSLFELGRQALMKAKARLPSAEKNRADELKVLWLDIAQAMIAARPEERWLIDTILEHLRNSISSHWTWKRLWEALWEADVERPALVQLGLQWLSTEQQSVRVVTPGPVRITWSFMWRDLWQYAWEMANSSAATAAARREQKSTFDALGVIEELKTLAKPWLSVADKSAYAFGYVISEIVEHDRSSTWLEKARKLLERPPRDIRSWDCIWKSVYDHSSPEDRADLQRRLLEEFARLPEHAVVWPYIWREIWNHEFLDRQSLTELGERWLKSVSIRQRGWAIVWSILVAHQEMPQSLLTQGMDWLRRAKPARVSWVEVWARIYRTADTGFQEECRRLGIRWLVDQRRTRSEWVQILLHLLAHDGTERILLQLAEDWIACHPTHPLSSAVTDALRTRQDAVEARRHSEVLFDGTESSFSHWERMGGPAPDDCGFQLDGKAIRTVGSGRPAWLVYRHRRFSDFVLNVEFSIERLERHLSGIALRCLDPHSFTSSLAGTRHFQDEQIRRSAASGFQVRIDDLGTADQQADFYGLFPEPSGLWKNRTGAIYKIPAGDRIWHQTGHDSAWQLYSPGPALVPGVRYELRIAVQGQDYQVELRRLDTGESTVTSRFSNQDERRGLPATASELSGYIGIESWPDAPVLFHRISVQHLAARPEPAGVQER